MDPIRQKVVATIPQWILLVCVLVAAGHDPNRRGEVGGPALCESGSMLVKF